MNFLRPLPALTVWLLLCLAPAGAGTPKPAVSFSPAVVDFGAVPSNAPCSQLVTVTFDRHVFLPEHLPTLRPNRSAYAVSVALFARFVEADTIRVVYRVTVNAYFCIGSFREGMVLVKDEEKFTFDLDPRNAEKADVVVTGQSVQGLTAPEQLSFGSIEVGQSKTKSLDIGFRAPPFASASQNAGGVGKNLFPHGSGLAGTTVTSSSANVTASNPREMGLNASVWQTWTVTFKSRLPLGRQTAELQFQTKSGYCATVQAVAEIVPRSKPELHTRTKH